MVVRFISGWYDRHGTIRPPEARDMAKKKAGVKKMAAVATKAVATKEVRHARIELPDEDYERLKRVANANGLGVAAYIRQAVLRQVRRDEDEVEGGAK
jgi:hypothetical protein